jgi:hypothetical protein
MLQKRSLLHQYVLIKNWIFALSNGIICLNFKNIIFQDMEISNHKIKSVILLIISLYCKTVWLNRNVATISQID